MDYRESLDWLYSTQMFGIKLGLENAHRLVAALDAYPTCKKIVHVAGTNGKGSICAMAESIARAAGFHTGLFTSPHLVRYNERIKIDGNDIDDDAIAASLSHIRELICDWQPHPTFFEISTALGLYLFKKHGCEVIILETGMGGRLDATNIVTPGVSVLTRIDFDHAQWLGDSLEKIATEKAGIIKPTIPAITCPQTPEAMDVFQKTALRNGSSLDVVDVPYQASRIALKGEHQARNAALAIRSLEIVGLDLTETSISEGLENVNWPGRFQEIRPGIHLDGAHNPAAAETLVTTWNAFGGPIAPTIVIGMLADKEISRAIAVLNSIAGSWVAVPVKSPRSLPPEELAEVIRNIGGSNIRVSHSLAETLAQTQPPLLICGSLFLVGESLAYFQQLADIRPTAQ